jgi:hypothetical protein
MSQLLSLRTNHSLHVDTTEGVLVPITEVVLLIEEPEYELKKNVISRKQKPKRLAFQVGTKGLDNLIEGLMEARKNMLHYQAISESLKSTDFTPVAGQAVKK